MKVFSASNDCDQHNNPSGFPVFLGVMAVADNPAALDMKQFLVNRSQLQRKSRAMLSYSLKSGLSRVFQGERNNGQTFRLA
jgi:hypothetical protein